jgi:hypothetical protein
MKVSSYFFCKKSNQKNFCSRRGRGEAGDRHALSAHNGHRPRRARVASKSFCALFLKSAAYFF